MMQIRSIWKDHHLSFIIIVIYRCQCEEEFSLDLFWCQCGQLKASKIMICLYCLLVCFFALLCSNKVACSPEQNKSSKRRCLYGQSHEFWVQLIIDVHELICGWQAKGWYKLTCSSPIEMQKLLLYITFNNITPCVLVACRKAATIIRPGNLSNINHISFSSDL